MSRPSRALRARTAVAVLAASMLVPTAAAHGETVAVHDAVGDVESSYLEQDDVPAPHYAAADITRTVTSYRTAQLKVTVHLRDLRNASALQTYVVIRTPLARFVASVVRGPRAVKTAFGHRRRGELECEGFTGTYEGGKDRVTLVVPPECIDSPRWVQVGVTTTGVELEDAETAAEEFPLQLDDANRDGDGEENVRLGQRIRRG